MGAYRSAENPDRAKAIAGVALVHVGLGALILSGLTVTNIAQKSEALKVFDISDDVPPPPIEPPPPDVSAAVKDDPAPANIRSTPTEIVAPRQVSLPVPLPMTAALAPGEGVDPSAGASSVRGAGTGAGGTGTGTGGGGSGGAGAGFTPAQRLSRIPDREYRRLVALSGRARGSVGITLKVNTDGRPSNCRVARTSGDGAVDSLMCRLALQYVRFRPARDPRGAPVAQDITWYPDWAPNG
jgi:protein TonB